MNARPDLRREKQKRLRQRKLGAAGWHSSASCVLVYVVTIVKMQGG